MSEEEKKALMEIIGFKGDKQTSIRPRLVIDQEFLRKWKQWNEDRHKEFSNKLKEGD